MQCLLVETVGPIYSSVTEAWHCRKILTESLFDKVGLVISRATRLEEAQWRES